VIDEGGPDWVRDALHQFLDEVRSYLRTAYDFTVQPRRFAREWATGERRALNPLGFLATAFAIVGPLDAVAAHFMSAEETDPSLLLAALGALLPFAYYLLLGTVQHGVLKLCGARRPLRDTCAMALYAGGGPATAANVAVLLLLLVRSRFGGGSGNASEVVSIVVSAGASASFTMFFLTLGFALGALHGPSGIRVWHMVLANCVALVVGGFWFALLDPPGNFGLHMVLGPHHTAHGWELKAGLQIF
jgi:hypothetical protein